MQEHLKAAAAAIDYAMAWCQTDEGGLWGTVYNSLSSGRVDDLPASLPPMKNPLEGLENASRLATAIRHLNLAGLAAHPVTAPVHHPPPHPSTLAPACLFHLA